MKPAAIREGAVLATCLVPMLTKETRDFQSESD